MEKLVAESQSFSELIRKMGIRYRSGAAWAVVKRRVQEMGIDFSHFSKKRGKDLPSAYKSWEEILVNDPERKHRESGKRLRRALKESGVEERCKSCLMLPFWNGKPLTFDVDHTDGDWRNNDRGNLRFLCPNCHTQEETSGRLSSRQEIACDGSVGCSCVRCKNTRNGALATHREKGNWPGNLEEMVESIPMTAIAFMVGVSEAAVRKRMKKLGLKSKPQGFWKKRADDRRPGGSSPPLAPAAPSSETTQAMGVRVPPSPRAARPIFGDVAELV